jgi:hypothetical protein
MQTALKLPYAGYRNRSYGIMGFQGSAGRYWSSSPSGTYGFNMLFDSTYIYSRDSDTRAFGFSVRCFKN